MKLKIHFNHKEELWNSWSHAGGILLGVIVTFIVAGMVRRVNVYDAFIEGAKEGFQTAVRIIPYLVAILVAVGVFRASGAMDRLMARIALGLGWRIVDELPARDDGDMARLEATARGLLSGVTADIVVRIYADGTGTRIDLRSSSRTGAFDFGENAGRIRDFLSELDHQTGEG